MQIWLFSKQRDKGRVKYGIYPLRLSVKEVVFIFYAYLNETSHEIQR